MICNVARSLFFLIFLLPLQTQAQVFYDVPNPFLGTPSAPASVSIVGITVTVKPLGSPGIYSGCNTGPFWIGSGGAPNGYRFIFSEPVTRVRAQLTNLNQSEVISVAANGAPYNVQQSNLSPYSGSCVLLTSTAMGGKIGSNISNSGAQFDLDLGIPIDSVDLYHENGFVTGTHFTFSFQGNPKVYISPAVADTQLCKGDTIVVGYSAIATFDAGNVFKLELSDANGSFATPTVLGITPAASGSGVISGRIPAGIATGSKYRLRINGTHPSRNSPDNGKDLSINPYPATKASSNGPVCSGEDILLSATGEDGCIFTWTGPNGFTFNGQNTTITAATTINEGVYTANADLYGCIAADTADVSIKPQPIITSTNNNSPLCEGDSIVLSAVSTLGNTTFQWVNAAGNVTIGNPAVIKNANQAMSGTYTVVATSSECVSQPVTADISVKPLPATPTANNNGPLYPGDELKLTGYSATPGVSYLWSGPFNFTSKEANPVVGPAVTSENSTYKLTVSIDGCSLNTETFVRVYESEYYLLYPNPTTGGVTIKMNIKESKEIPIEILNFAGQVVQKETGQTISGLMVRSFQLHDNLTNGLYFMRIANGKKTKTIKFQLHR